MNLTAFTSISMIPSIALRTPSFFGKILFILVPTHQFILLSMIVSLVFASIFFTPWAMVANLVPIWPSLTPWVGFGAAMLSLILL